MPLHTNEAVVAGGVSKVNKNHITPLTNWLLGWLARWLAGWVFVWSLCVIK